MPLRVPSLREHPEDIPALVAHFSDQSAKEAGSLRKRISDKAMEKLIQHTWPGNVRELRNFIERVYILTPGDFADVHDLRFAGLATDNQWDANSLDGSHGDSNLGSELSTFRDARAEFEKNYILKKIIKKINFICKRILIKYKKIWLITYKKIKTLFPEFVNIRIFSLSLLIVVLKAYRRAVP